MSFLFIVYGSVTPEAMFSLVEALARLGLSRYSLIHFSEPDFVWALKRFKESTYDYLVYISGSIVINGDNLGKFINVDKEGIVFSLARKFEDEIVTLDSTPMIPSSLETFEGEDDIKGCLWPPALDIVRVDRSFLDGVEMKAKDGDYAKTLRWQNKTYRGEDAVIGRYLAATKNCAWYLGSLEFSWIQTVRIEC